MNNISYRKNRCFVKNLLNEIGLDDATMDIKFKFKKNRYVIKVDTFLWYVLELVTVALCTMWLYFCCVMLCLIF